jgi:tRNA U34 5-methylaminomethyl-2-thiouridine-forming methyltransferase MnmC
LLTKIRASKQGQEVRYTGVEKFPVLPQEANQLNYATALNQEELDFKSLHQSPWERWNQLSPDFSFFKHQNDFASLNYSEQFDVIYFDAFGPRVQPELWTEAIFKSMFAAVSRKGVLVTYCSQGNARRAMTKVGFTVDRLPGPPGKRHMLRAVKMQ